MKKRNMARCMWYLFAAQLILAACMTVFCFAGVITCLHSTERTNGIFAHYLPMMRQHLQTEQDPERFRQEALGLLDQVVSDARLQETELRFMVKISVLGGFALFTFTLGLGLFANRLHHLREES